MHEHKCTGCKHDCLHYCECCQKVYCCKCGREWENPHIHYYSGTTWYYPTTTPYNPYWPTTTIRYDAGNIPVCTHSH